jgi:photosynthetic reaction center cytochrome c subunit
MRPKSIRVFACLILAISAIVPCSTQTASDSAAGTTKTTEQAYKNIQVLKGVPADQLIPAMQFITASLGVQCDFCHVENAFEKDDKPPKQTARKMIQMTMTLNKENFQGQRKVTCFACHRGGRKPVTTPILAEGDPIPPLAGPDQSPSAPNLPTAESILKKYLEALGGVEALAKISTRAQQGTVTIGQKSFPVEVLSEAPDKRLTTVHFNNGDNVTAVSADEGWTSTPGHPAREMSAIELDVARVEARAFFANTFRTSFKEMKVVAKNAINGKDCFLVSATREGAPPTYFYFEAESGLLVRMLQYTETPLGNNPTQIDYADYREQDGLKVPFGWSVSRPNRRFSTQIEKMQQNVPIDQHRFAKPVNSSAP